MGRRPGGDAPPWQDFSLVQRAAAEAARLHRGDRRKGTDIPYVAHLWSVAALVLEHGGDDAQVAAGFLHDAAEDHGGEARLVAIADDFGEDVAELVEALSDSLVDTEGGAGKAPWIERKGQYLERLGEHDRRVLLVSACDKLHNARTILADYRAMGPELWQKFNEKRPEWQLWYYRSLIGVYERHGLGEPAGELRRVIDQLEALVAADVPDLPERLRAVGLTPL